MPYQRQYYAAKRRQYVKRQRSAPLYKKRAFATKIARVWRKKNPWKMTNNAGMIVYHTRPQQLWNSKRRGKKYRMWS